MRIFFNDTFSEKRAFDLISKLIINSAQEYYKMDRDSIIYKRLRSELKSIKEKKMCTEVLICYILCQFLSFKGEKYVIDGIFGEYLSAFLLGISVINPLPRHYICPKCYNVQVNKRKRKRDVFIYDDQVQVCSICKSKKVPEGMNLFFKDINEFFLRVNNLNIFDLDEINKFISESISIQMNLKLMDRLTVREAGVIVKEDKNVRFVAYNSGNARDNIFAFYHRAEKYHIHVNDVDLEKQISDLKNTITIRKVNYYCIDEIEEMLYRKGVKELEIYDVACHLLGIKKMCETLENKYGLEYKYGIAKSLESFSYLWNITQETFRTDR